MKRKIVFILLTALLLFSGCSTNKEVQMAETCTLSVSCETVWQRPDLLPDGMAELLPADGQIFPAQAVPMEEGDSAFSLLQRALREAEIHLEFVETPVYGSAYIEGIANLYEFDCGEGSGWMYKVNGSFPGGGSSNCKLNAGDVVEWIYTCNLGADVGAKK